MDRELFRMLIDSICLMEMFSFFTAKSGFDGNPSF